MIELGWPWLLLLLPAPFLLRRLVPAAPLARAGALRVPFYDGIAGIGGTASAATARRRWVLGTMSAIWVALVIAAARPAWVGEPLPLPAEGRDLMLVTDLSGSMARDDFTLGGAPADRLTVVKQVADEFIGRRDGDRVGLVLFGTRPYLQAPLTFDRATVRTLLDEAEVGMAGDETAIGDALGMAVKRLKDRPAQSRVAVLLTDGASNAGTLDPREAARLAAEEGIRVYTIGVGADAVAVPGLFGDRVVNPSADLDEETLQAIADQTGGAYFRAKNVEGLANVYRQIDALEPMSAEPLYLRPTKELFPWPLGMALAMSLGLGLALSQPWHSLAAGRAASGAASEVLS
jgi:Ca-activated chloride channel family protein